MFKRSWKKLLKALLKALLEKILEKKKAVLRNPPNTRHCKKKPTDTHRDLKKASRTSFSLAFDFVKICFRTLQTLDTEQSRFSKERALF